MDWLEQKTQRPLVYWIQRIQFLIGKHTSTPAEETVEKDGVLQSVAHHGATDSRVWMHMLVEEIMETLPISGSITGVPPYDENMRVASIMGMVLSAWYAAVHQAKCFDPNRPATTRRTALQAFTTGAVKLRRLRAEIEGTERTALTGVFFGLRHTDG